MLRLLSLTLPPTRPGLALRLLVLLLMILLPFTLWFAGEEARAELCRVFLVSLSLGLLATPSTRTVAALELVFRRLLL